MPTNLRKNDAKLIASDILGPPLGIYTDIYGKKIKEKKVKKKKSVLEAVYGEPKSKK